MYIQEVHTLNCFFVLLVAVNYVYYDDAVRINKTVVENAIIFTFASVQPQNLIQCSL